MNKSSNDYTVGSHPLHVAHKPLQNCINDAISITAKLQKTIGRLIKAKYTSMEKHDQQPTGLLNSP